MKCKTFKCKAKCCYNIPFANGELDTYADKIVNPIKSRVGVFGGIVAFTSDKWQTNKCPFLRPDYKCNIYEHRPEVCRKYGQIDELRCKYC